MKEKRPPIYLITGIVIGVLAGFLIAYVLLPVNYADTLPSTLSEQQKDIYRSLVGRAYLYEADSGRAFSRLALLGDVDLNSVLVAQSQQLLAAGGDVDSARGLSLLAAAINQPGQVITPLVQSSELAITESTPIDGTSVPTLVIATETPLQPSATPFATFTPRPSATPKPTQGAPYKLVNQSGNCSENDKGSLLIVKVFDTAGNGIAGVKIEISTNNGGATDFFTGLYPEINNGYADYTMDPGVVYSIRVGVGGPAITGLELPTCTSSDGNPYTVNLELTFKQ
ncbi:MAG: hypothetical protein AB9897_03755 [Anaerolineaceae bacterium]